MSHSPLPWGVNSIGEIVDSNGAYVAEVESGFDASDSDARNLIVTAVNNHAKLVDLLGWMVKQFQGDSGTGDEYWSQFPQYVQARELVVDLGTEHDVWSPVQEGIDWTVDIPGIGRHHCEKPWTYVVRATDSSSAMEKAIAHYRHDTGDSDIDVGYVTVSPGVPVHNCGFKWNDLRPTQDVAQP